jgi:hypothetical protein
MWQPSGPSLSSLLTIYKSYQWGFSFIQLFIMIILLLVWAVGTYIMWLRSDIVMRRRSREEVTGEYKAILELSEAIRKQLDGHMDLEGDGVSAATESSLRRRITKDLRGGSIAYVTPLLSNRDGGVGDTDWGIKSWIWSEVWWLTLVVLTLAGALAIWITLPGTPGVVIGSGVCGLLVTLFLTMYISTSRKSRAVLFIWSFFLLTLVPQAVALLAIMYGG